jgi:hypothetical protein
LSANSFKPFQVIWSFEILFEIPQGGKRTFYARSSLQADNHISQRTLELQGRKAHGPS